MAYYSTTATCLCFFFLIIILLIRHYCSLSSAHPSTYHPYVAVTEHRLRAEYEQWRDRIDKKLKADDDLIEADLIKQDPKPLSGTFTVLTPSATMSTTVGQLRSLRITFEETSAEYLHPVEQFYSLLPSHTHQYPLAMKWHQKGYVWTTAAGWKPEYIQPHNRATATYRYQNRKKENKKTNK